MFDGLISPGGLVRPLIFGCLMYRVHSVMIHEHFSTANMLTVQQKSQFWQCPGIGLDVSHTVTLPESAISLQKESNSLQKRVGRSNALKWGLAEMVVRSVHGWSRFAGFFAV